MGNEIIKLMEEILNDLKDREVLLREKEDKVVDLIKAYIDELTPDEVKRISELNRLIGEYL